MGTSLFQQLITPATEAVTAFRGGQQEANAARVKEAMQRQQVEQQQKRSAIADALTQAQAAKLRRETELLGVPKPVEPRNIDPNSPEGIAARLEFEKGKAALAPPEQKAPVLGTPEHLAAQTELEKMRAGLRPQRQAGTGMTNSNMLSLRGQFNNEQTVKNAAEISTALRKVRASGNDPSPAGDISLLVGYMKLLDPGSVVREQEFATAAKAGSLPQAIQAAGLKVVNGQRLTPEQRADFIQKAEAVAKSYGDQLGLVRTRYSKDAEAAGLDPSRVVYDPMEGLFDAAPPATAGGGGRAGGRGGVQQSGNINLGGKPPLSESDRQKAATNPAFAKWLRSRGYEVP